MQRWSTLTKSWVTQETTGVSQGTMLFYTAIASFTMYSLFSGVVCAAYLNGNLSPIGRRIMGSPFSKGKLIANCFMIGLLLNIASNAIMLVYTTQVLKINLFADWAGSLLLMLLGNVFGIAAGLLIGTNQNLQCKAESSSHWFQTSSFQHLREWWERQWKDLPIPLCQDLTNLIRSH